MTDVPSVSLSVTGLPSGVTATFSPTTIAGVGSSTMTLTASTSAPYGSYPITIKGTSGYLAFTRLEQLTHVGENLLSRLNARNRAEAVAAASRQNLI